MKVSKTRYFKIIMIVMPIS